MKRRQVARTVLALAVGGEWLPRAALAQQRARPWRIGRLGAGAPENASAFIQAQDEGMREHGLVEGRDIESVFRWARSLDALPALATELVAQSLPVDLILASNSLVIGAAQRQSVAVVANGPGARPAATSFDVHPCVYKQAGRY